jgi:hypothetical protein
MERDNLDVNYAGMQIQAGGKKNRKSLRKGKVVYGGGGCGCGGSFRQMYGGSNGATSMAAKTARALVGNRVLDLYLKYLGVTLLSTSTLVPFALVLGRDAFKAVVDEMKRQKGGNSLKETIKNTKIPVVDDKLFGTYLALTGLSALQFTPQTLVPLGILMAAYHYYMSKNGSGRGNREQNMGRGRKFYKKYMARNLQGGASSPFTSVPSTVFQTTFDKLNNGQANVMADKVPNADPVGGYQSQTSMGPLPNDLPTERPAPFNSQSGSMIGQRGGSSAWAASQYSRGPVNYPNMHMSDFRAFTKTGDYIANSDMAGAAAAPWADGWKGWEYTAPQIIPPGYETLYQQTPAGDRVDGYNIAGVASSPYQRGGKNDNELDEMEGGRLVEKIADAIEEMRSKYVQRGGQVYNVDSMNAMMGSELLYQNMQDKYDVPSWPYQSGGKKRRHSHKNRN